MSKSDVLKIFTLGDIRIMRGDQPVDTLRSRKARALLVYLACTAEPQSREGLAELFWSESSPSRAMSNLRDAIHALRTNLEPYLDIGRYSIALNSGADVWIDVTELETALECLRESEDSISADTAERMENALKLYQKDFLEGFYLRGARGFEEWQVVERERIRLAALDGLISLVKHQTVIGNHRKGIHYARQALELEPLMEVGHQQLMRLLALSGRSSEALLQYETCRQILEKELGVEPSEETKKLYTRLLEGKPLPGSDVKLPRHNLPLPLINLIGRDNELSQIARELEQPDCRLLTLIGVGGIGKTRLSLHASAAAVDQFPEGVWLVELAAFNEDELLPNEIAAVFGVSAQEARTGVSVTDVLIDYLKEKTLLLVLDNCEHLVESCAWLAESLLSGCPNVKILATSREAFGIYQEKLFQVSPLSLPPQGSSTEKLESFPAIQLFLERAAAAQPEFHLSAANSPVLAEICWQLEGIPLAIELAAARVKVLSLNQITRRLQDRFQLLTGGPRTALPRHQTLQATMDWSYGLLPQLERTLLRRLSVFSGSWTLRAAEKIVSFGDLTQQKVLDLLSNLVDKSLVQVEDQGARVRYGMLETVRQYGLQMLSEEGELEETRQRHANFFILVAEQMDEGLRDARQVESVDVLDAEHDNLRGALRWATDNNKKSLAFRLVGALGWFWFMRGHWKESWRWFQITNGLESGFDPIIRAKAICRAVGLQIIRGNMIGTIELVQEAIDVFREAGEEEGLAWSLNLMGQSKTWINNEFDQAMPYLSESAELFRGGGNDWGVAFTLPFIGQVQEFQGDYQRSVNSQKEAIAIFERIGDEWNQAYYLYLLGSTATRNKDYPLSQMALEQSLEKCSLIKDKVMEAHALKGLGQLALQKDELLRAEEILLVALEALQKIGDEYCVATTLKGLGEAAQRKGDYPKAAKLLGQSLLSYKRLGLDDRVVMLIDRFASLTSVSGNSALAAKLLGASKILDREKSLLFTTQYMEERENLTISIREKIGASEFDKLFKEGASMSLEDASATALEDFPED
ncbi:MAG: BTAD domain-containing putative transcriptional regulator [Chloroflexota bacterium]